jgi:hypothetical protein
MLGGTGILETGDPRRPRQNELVVICSFPKFGVNGEAAKLLGDSVCSLARVHGFRAIRTFGTEAAWILRCTKECAQGARRLIWTVYLRKIRAAV